jgi:hypothetical protein
VTPCAKKENFEKLRLFGAAPVFISTSIFEISFFNHWFMHKKAMFQHFWPSSSCIQD